MDPWLKCFVQSNRLCPVFCAVYSKQCILQCSVQCSAVYCTLPSAARCTVHCPVQRGVLYTAQCSAVYCTLHSAARCTLQCTVHRGVLYTAQCSTVYCTLHSAAQCTVQCTLQGCVCSVSRPRVGARDSPALSPQARGRGNRGDSKTPCCSKQIGEKLHRHLFLWENLGTKMFTKLLIISFLFVENLLSVWENTLLKKKFLWLRYIYHKQISGQDHWGAS